MLPGIPGAGDLEKGRGDVPTGGGQEKAEEMLRSKNPFIFFSRCLMQCGTGRLVSGCIFMSFVFLGGSGGVVRGLEAGQNIVAIL